MQNFEFRSWNIVNYSFCNKSNTKPIILSFSFGLLSAIKMVKDVKADSDTLAVCNKPVFCKKHTKAKASLRLFPSLNG